MPSEARPESRAGRRAPGGRRRLVLTAGVAAMAAWAAACATAGSSQIQTDLDGIQQQLWKVQKDNAALADQIAAMRQAAPAGGGPAAAGLSPELRLRLEAIDRDLQVLRSRADDSDRRLSGVAEDLRATRESLRALIQSLPAAAGAAGTPAGTPPIGGPPASGTEPRGTPQTAPQASPAPGGPGTVGASETTGAAGILPGGAGGPAGAGAAAPLAADDLYRRGYTDYSKGNYAMALQELNEFVRRYPASALADDAQFLIGEVQYGQQRYAEAIAAYDQLLQAYPNGDKASSAYLKKGLALLEINRTAEAVIQLQHVVSAFPRSEEARIARERLRGLGLKER